MLFRKTMVAASLAALSACAAAPGVETAISGVLPAGRSYALVDGTRYYGRADLPFAAVETCLAKGGMHPVAAGAGSPDTLVQLADTVRPARSRLVRLEDGAAKPRGRRSASPSEELVLGVSDAASGKLVLRASAARVLGKNEQSGPGSQLVDALCGTILAPPAASAP